MSSNLLKVLREALPGSPSLKDVANAIGCSFSYLSKFERGDYQLNEEMATAYAKHMRVPVREVMMRFHQVAIERATREVADHRRELKKLGVSNVYRKKPWRAAG